MPLAPNELTAQQVAAVQFSIKSMVRLLGKLYEFHAQGSYDPTVKEIPLDPLKNTILAINALPITKDLTYKATGSELKAFGEIDVDRLDNNEIYLTLDEDQKKGMKQLEGLMNKVNLFLKQTEKHNLPADLKNDLKKTLDQVESVQTTLRRIAPDIAPPKPERQPIVRPQIQGNQFNQFIKENYDPSTPEKPKKPFKPPKAVINEPPPKPPKSKHK